jgi:hypothetical protein
MSCPLVSPEKTWLCALRSIIIPGVDSTDFTLLRLLPNVRSHTEPAQIHSPLALWLIYAPIRSEEERER